MPQLNRTIADRKMRTIKALDREFEQWRNHYLSLAEYILPRKYTWLSDSAAMGRRDRSEHVSKKIIDSTGTRAARKLAAGMMGGLTSPTRPWFRLNLQGQSAQTEEPLVIRQYLDEVQKIIQLVMASSNFYLTLASTYLDLGVFGTAAFVIYEDEEHIIRCYPSPMGEFRIAQDSRRMVNTFSRTFRMTVDQIVTRFGIENASQKVQEAYRKGGERLQEESTICHLIEPNDEREEFMGPDARFREFYWEKKENSGLFLEYAAYPDKPMMVPRWDLTGMDVYGTSPGMDCLPDIKQLQQETIRKAQGIDKMVNPPMQADAAIKNFGTPAPVPGGITYVPSGTSIGVKPLYEVNLPVGELRNDIMELQVVIKETFYNDLFDMISQLQTVRSATEIDARQEEKLVLLGPVLERFENEVLDPSVMRIYSILEKRQMLPDPPAALGNQGIEIRYTSILAEAQKAIGVGSLERFLQMIGNMAQLFPGVTHLFDENEFAREYADQLNVPAVALRSRDEVAKRIQGEQQQQQQQMALEQGAIAAGAAKDIAQSSPQSSPESVLETLTGV